MRLPRAGRVRRSAGFTIVELLIALVVLAVGLLAVASGMASVSRRQELATSRAEMLHLADAKFEQLRAAAMSRTADTVQLGIGGSTTSPQPAHADTAMGRGRSYVRLWGVTAGPSGSRRVTLRVRPMRDDPRTPARLEIATLILIM
jgi:prepilin-type N-terminal cleavage/methylation domain-containing protein